MSDISSIDLLFPNNQPVPVNLQHECNHALKELKNHAKFCPLIKDASHTNKAPYAIRLSIESRLLISNIVDKCNNTLPITAVSLSPYWSLLKDYKIIIDNYNIMRAKLTMPSKIEAIDMARRGIHNDGAALLMERLAEKIILDHPTARRFFTLLFILCNGMVR